MLPLLGRLSILQPNYKQTVFRFHRAGFSSGLMLFYYEEKLF